MKTASLRYFLLSLIIFILGQTVILKSLRGLLTPMVLPVQYGLSVSGAQINDILRLATGILSLRSDNLRLSSEVEDLRGQVVYLRDLEDENALLREQLSLVKETGLSGRMILAEVIGRDTQSGSFFLLNRGERAGISLGASVVYKKFLLGEVVEVGQDSSKVRTVYDPQFRVPGLSIDSLTRTKGMVRGEFSTSLLMEKILPEEEVSRGQIIVTSGEGGYPRSLILGMVKEVSSGDAQILKWARLTSLIDLSRVTKVFVLKP